MMDANGKHYDWDFQQCIWQNWINGKSCESLFLTIMIGIPNIKCDLFFNDFPDLLLIVGASSCEVKTLAVKQKEKRPIQVFIICICSKLLWIIFCAQSHPYPLPICLFTNPQRPPTYRFTEDIYTYHMNPRWLVVSSFSFLSDHLRRFKIVFRV